MDETSDSDETGEPDETDDAAHPEEPAEPDETDARSEPARPRTIFTLRHSRPGLAVAVLFFALSLAPSLLPRTGLFQGVVSGITAALGYGLGTLGAWLWRYLGIASPTPSSRAGRALTWGPVALIALVTVVFVWKQVGWQNDVRRIFGEEETGPSVWIPIVPVAAAVGALLMVISRSIGRLFVLVADRLSRLLPPRVANVVGAFVVLAVLSGLWSGVLVDGFFAAANRSFSVRDTSTPDGMERPTSALRSGGDGSLVPWSTLGRQGRRFVAGGPTQAELTAVRDEGGLEPIRVYVGLKSADTVQERADLLLAELRRTGAFDRKVLVLGTTTGTGFLEPNAVNSVEYLHGGDTAIAGVQYSYLPSWISLLADQQITRDTSRIVFDTVHAYWDELPEDARPDLYLFGLSLGSFGVESILTSVDIVNAPIDGALMVGPPFVNDLWTRLTAERDPGSSATRPVYEDGRTVRFTNRTNTLDEPTARWRATRIAYVQHASDPVSFFSTELAFHRPDWLDADQRGSDVSERMTWFPLVTMWQVLLDLPVAGNVPAGYGHLYTSREYLNAWVAITRPDNWTDADAERVGTALTTRERTVEE